MMQSTNSSIGDLPGSGSRLQRGPSAKLEKLQEIVSERLDLARDSAKQAVGSLETAFASVLEKAGTSGQKAAGPRRQVPSSSDPEGSEDLEGPATGVTSIPLSNVPTAPPVPNVCSADTSDPQALSDACGAVPIGLSEVVVHTMADPDVQDTDTLTLHPLPDVQGQAVPRAEGQSESRVLSLFPTGPASPPGALIRLDTTHVVSALSGEPMDLFNRQPLGAGRSPFDAPPDLLAPCQDSVAATAGSLPTLPRSSAPGSGAAEGFLEGSRTLPQGSTATTIGSSGHSEASLDARRVAPSAVETSSECGPRQLSQPAEETPLQHQASFDSNVAVVGSLSSACNVRASLDSSDREADNASLPSQVSQAPPLSNVAVAGSPTSNLMLNDVLARKGDPAPSSAQGTSVGLERSDVSAANLQQAPCSLAASAASNAAVTGSPAGTLSRNLISHPAPPSLASNASVAGTPARRAGVSGSGGGNPPPQTSPAAAAGSPDGPAHNGFARNTLACHPAPVSVASQASNVLVAGTSVDLRTGLSSQASQALPTGRQNDDFKRNLLYSGHPAPVSVTSQASNVSDAGTRNDLLAQANVAVHGSPLAAPSGTPQTAKPAAFTRTTTAAGDAVSAHDSLVSVAGTPIDRRTSLPPQPVHGSPSAATTGTPQSATPASFTQSTTAAVSEHDSIATVAGTPANRRTSLPPQEVHGSPSAATTGTPQIASPASFTRTTTAAGNTVSEHDSIATVAGTPANRRTSLPPQETHGSPSAATTGTPQTEARAVVASNTTSERDSVTSVAGTPAREREDPPFLSVCKPDSLHSPEFVSVFGDSAPVEPGPTDSTSTSPEPQREAGPQMSHLAASLVSSPPNAAPGPALCKSYTFALEPCCPPTGSAGPDILHVLPSGQTILEEDPKVVLTAKPQPKLAPDAVASQVS